MAERFVYSTGTLSVGLGDNSVVGTGTSWGGHDWAGASIYAYPVSPESPDEPIAAIFVGIVAETTSQGEYDDLELPLIFPYRGADLLNAQYTLVDGPAIANGASQAAIFARFAAFLIQSMGLAGNSADDIDYSLVPNNSLFVNAVTNRLYQWRSGVLEDVYTQLSGLDLASQAYGDYSDISGTGGGTIDIGSLNTLGARITGTSGTITSFGSQIDRLRHARFASAGLVLQHNATSLNLPSGANITVAAGDRLIAVSDDSGNWNVLVYVRATGRAIIEPTLAELGGLALSGGTMTGTLTLVAGTTTVAAAKAVAGALLTTPAAGAFEFDGTILGFTPVNNNRAVIPVIHFKALTADVAATSGSAAQPWFPSAGAITLPASTSYFFEGQLLLSTGTTTHTTALSFGGTASLTSIAYVAFQHNGTASQIQTTISRIFIATAASTVINATSTAVETVIEVRGIIRINAGGTLIPQFTFSANPTGTNNVKANTFFKLTPIGANTVVSHGAWA